MTLQATQRGFVLVAVMSGVALACSVVSNFDHLSDGVRPTDAAPAEAASDAASSDAADATDATSRCAEGRGPRGISVGSFCIDSTEVTNAHYADFLAAKGTDVSGQPAGCELNTTYTPNNGWPVAPNRATYPVTNVDWCDAFMFCQWAGKRLCGAIGGGPVTYGTNNTNPAEDQWYFACSKGGTLAYPYGDAFRAGVCNTLASNTNATVAVGSLPECVGGFPELSDMSGNVNEWTDSCEVDGGATAYCRYRGGDFKRDENESRCNSLNGSTRQSGFSTLGFRCCRD